MEKTSTGGSPDDLRILEAVLFASDELMAAAHLKTILPSQPDARKIRSMVEKINMQLQKERHPFEIVEIGGGYQFRTITYYHPWVRQIFKEKAAKKLSIQALECLAIIAYKQPISKAEIEVIRGVVSDGAMKTLLEKRLVTIAGRSDKPGRPLLYGTTQTFLKYFGLNRKEDLPRIEEFEAMAREKMEGLSIDDLEQEEIDMKVDATDDGAAVQTSEPAQDPSSLFELELTGDTSVAAQSVASGNAPADSDMMSAEDTQPILPPEKNAGTGLPEAAASEVSFEPEAESESIEAQEIDIAVKSAPVETTTGIKKQTERVEDDAADMEVLGGSAVDFEVEEPRRDTAAQESPAADSQEVSIEEAVSADPTPVDATPAATASFDVSAGDSDEAEFDLEAAVVAVEPEMVIETDRSNAVSGEKNLEEVFNLEASVESVPAPQPEPAEASTAPAADDVEEFELETSLVSFATEEERVAETPTVKIDVIESADEPAAGIDSPESTEFDLESELQKTADAPVHGEEPVAAPQTVGAPEAAEFEVAAAVPQEKAPAGAAALVSEEADFELDLPVAPEATEVEFPVKKVKKQSTAKKKRIEQQEELFEPETTVASLADIEKKESVPPVVTPDEDEEEVFEFDASLIPASEEDQKAVSMSGKTREEEPVPLPDADESMFEVAPVPAPTKSVKGGSKKRAKAVEKKTVSRNGQPEEVLFEIGEIADGAAAVVQTDGEALDGEEMNFEVDAVDFEVKAPAAKPAGKKKTAAGKSVKSVGTAAKNPVKQTEGASRRTDTKKAAGKEPSGNSNATGSGENPAARKTGPKSKKS